MTPLTKKGMSAGLIWLFIFIAIPLLILAGWGIGKYAGLFSIAATSHQISALGQNWTATGPFGTDNSNYACIPTLTDTSYTGQVSFNAKATNLNTGCNFALGTNLRLDTVDLSKYKSVTIRRSGSIDVTESGSNAASLYDYINGQAATVVIGDLTYGRSAYAPLGDIYVTNDGTVIKIQAGAMTQLLDAHKSAYLENYFGASTNGGANVNYRITGVELVSLIGQPGAKAAPTGFSAVLSQILDWIKESFSKLFTFSIAGATSVTPGSVQSYQLSLPEPYPLLTDYTQGVFMQRWCSAALIDKEQRVVNELPFESCTGTWNKTYTITMPSGSFTDYAIIGVMVETRQDFASGAWATTYANKVVSKESLSLTSKVLVAPATAAKPSGFAAFWGAITTWFKGLFGL